MSTSSFFGPGILEMRPSDSGLSLPGPLSQASAAFETPGFLSVLLSHLRTFAHAVPSTWNTSSLLFPFDSLPSTHPLLLCSNIPSSRKHSLIPQSGLSYQSHISPLEHIPYWQLLLNLLNYLIKVCLFH